MKKKWWCFDERLTHFFQQFSSVYIHTICTDWSQLLVHDDWARICWWCTPFHSSSNSCRSSWSLDNPTCRGNICPRDYCRRLECNAIPYMLLLGHDTLADPVWYIYLILVFFFFKMKMLIITGFESRKWQNFVNILPWFCFGEVFRDWNFSSSGWPSIVLYCAIIDYINFRIKRFQRKMKK